ncbi:MAG: hypothetical protein R3E79_08985 [Caldilineaceae bacterium]
MPRANPTVVPMFLAFLLFAVCVALFASPDSAVVAQAEQVMTADVIPAGGFVADGPAVNAAATTGASPALAINPAGEVWTALRQNNQIVVTKLDPATGAWVQQGAVLNTGVGSNPTLAFGGVNRSIPWATWTETVGNAKQIMTARFEGNLWQPTGMLNLPMQNGDAAALAMGATVTDALPLPWVAWASTSGIAVKGAMTDANDQGGVQWESIGDTLALAPGSSAADPDLVFGGAGHHTPWLAWLEADSGGGSFVFAARAVADSGASGGLQWEAVGTVAACVQANCSLTADTGKPGMDVQLTAGALVGEATAKPWLVFAVAVTSNQREIRAMRLDDGDTPADRSDDRFIPAGVAINTQCLGDAGMTSTNGSQPDIFFVGAVPHVAWDRNKRRDWATICLSPR